jgi:nicotinamidase-related amidase
MNTEQFIEQSKPFLNYVVDWKNNIKPALITEIINNQPEKVAVVSVDIINGFCYEGPLASERVANLVDPIADLFQKSYDTGIRNFILAQDAHPADAVEFENFPPHCIRDTSESNTVEKLKKLPFFDMFEIISKQSLSAVIGTDFETWLSAHPQVDRFLVVGDCTDLCTYQLAMGLKLRANVRNEKVRIILPVNCVDTYDLPVSVATEIGAIPHDGDFLHQIFLYHMMLNGIEVVSEIGNG